MRLSIKAHTGGISYQVVYVSKGLWQLDLGGAAC